MTAATNPKSIVAVVCQAHTGPSPFYFDCGLADAVRLENNFELRDVGGATVVAATTTMNNDKSGGTDENHSATVDRGRLDVAAHAQMKLPELKKQPTPQAVLDEHFAALNACDWDRLLAQYPEDAQIHLANGMIIKGRAAIGDLFVGFCRDPKEGGLKGMQFAPEHSMQIDVTLATQWVATAPFLAEPLPRLGRLYHS